MLVPERRQAMRILMASFGYPPILNGVTLVAQTVARAMVQKDHEVVVVTAEDIVQYPFHSSALSATAYEPAASITPSPSVRRRI
jgi:hypothetical protein